MPGWKPRRQFQRWRQWLPFTIRLLLVIVVIALLIRSGL
jgi:hypothetical protein